MTKLSTHSSFIAKVGVLFLVLVVGAYAKSTTPLAEKAESMPVKTVVDTSSDIDANTLIRTVSYRSAHSPLSQLRKK